MATVSKLLNMKQAREKIAVLTVYDATFSTLINGLGVDVLMVGDSLGNVIQGQDSTVYVTVEDMIYHTRCVKRGSGDAFIVVDMPFMSYFDTKSAIKNAAKLMQAGANMVKMEGGAWLFPTVKALVERGIPVCGHLGLTPQSVNTMGGYKIQGKDETSAESIEADAQGLEHAGAQLLVLECIPRQLAKKISPSLTIPVIGIGAGPDCDGQVLVLHDMLGITPGKQLKFSRNFMSGSTDGISGAIASYISAVKSGEFPAEQNCF